MLKRVKGIHHSFTKDGHPERIAIPVHGNEPLKIGLLRSLMKIASLPDGEL
jgi:predicted RNA binding protein YcfA (HicA-like mRNA interferase family)